MATPDDLTPSTAPPSTLVKRRPRWSASLIWLVPAIAVLLGLSVAVRAWSSTGPHIQISFITAEGLEAGKTQVRFKNVVIGSVGSIGLSPDRSHVIVNVTLSKAASAFATDGSRFWVVRPRIGAGGVSGIDTLLSGAFIGADAGDSQNEQDTFVGLETPPPVTHGEAGREFVLQADDLGSLDIGSPVYFRRIHVGRVVGIKLGDDGREIGVTVFVSAPHDRLVTRSTRFWNASGLDVSIGANGLRVNAQSLATVIGGGIAFQSGGRRPDTTPAPVDTVFRLASDQRTALAEPDGASLAVSMRFRQSLRGLAVNAPVEFEGIELGHVVSVDLDYDAKTKTFSTIVGAVLFPQRLGQAYQEMLPEIQASKQGGPDNILRMLVDRGLRAQPRAGNLLTGQLFIAIGFMPDATKVAFDPNSTPIVIPTVGGQFDKLQEQIASIVGRVDKLPLDAIGQRLSDNLGSLDQTLKQVNRDVLPGLRDTLQTTRQTLGTAGKTLDSADQALGSVSGTLADDSSLRRDLAQTLQEVQRSARSLRDLTDLLSRHPEALIRGRDTSSSGPTNPSGSTTGSP